MPPKSTQGKSTQTKKHKPAKKSGTNPANKPANKPAKNSAKKGKSGGGHAAVNRTGNRKQQRENVASDSSKAGQDRFGYFDYYEEAELQRRHAAGTAALGTLRVYNNGAFVTVAGQATDVFIAGAQCRNRAIDGEQVYVQLLGLSRTRGGPPPDDATLQQEVASAVQGEPLPVAERLRTLDADGLQSLGVVVGLGPGAVQARADGAVQFVGSLQKPGMFYPLDARAPLVWVGPSTGHRGPVPPAQPDVRVRVQLVEWPVDSAWPRGVVSNVLGKALSMATEAAAALLSNGFESLPPNGAGYPADIAEAVVDEVREAAVPGSPDFPWHPDLSHPLASNRRDLRDRPIFTVDPFTARDLDDAVHIKEVRPGKVEVGVHIADVTAFVRPGTPVDDEAHKRTTTVYLVDRASPACPEELSSNACSLLPDVARLAVSCVWLVDEATGNIEEEWMGRSIIESAAKLSYSVAQHAIDGTLKTAWSDAMDDAEVATYRGCLGPYAGMTVAEIATAVRRLWGLAQVLRRRRFETGALKLGSIKMGFELNDVNEPVSVAPYITKEANWMIEELMLLANRRVASFLKDHYPNAAFIRQHSPPDASRMKEWMVDATLALKAAALRAGRPGKTAEVRFEPRSSAGLAATLTRMRKEVHPAIFEYLQDRAVRPMSLAKYYRVGAVKPAERGHFALAFRDYTHFTSPIRRYADVVVHRQLLAALGDAQAREDLARMEAAGKAMWSEGDDEEEDDDGVANDDEDGGRGDDYDDDDDNDDESGEGARRAKNPMEVYLDATAERCNEQRVKARDAQTYALSMCLAQFLSLRGPQLHLAIVARVQDRSVEVFFPNLGIMDRLFYDNVVLPDDVDEFQVEVEHEPLEDDDASAAAQEDGEELTEEEARRAAAKARQPKREFATTTLTWKPADAESGRDDESKWTKEVLHPMDAISVMLSLRSGGVRPTFSVHLVPPGDDRRQEAHDLFHELHTRRIGKAPSGVLGAAGAE